MKNRIFLTVLLLIFLHQNSALSQKKYATCGEALKVNINKCLKNSDIDNNAWQDCIQYGMDDYGFVYDHHYFLVGAKNFQCVDNNDTGRTESDYVKMK